MLLAEQPGAKAASDVLSATRNLAGHQGLQRAGFGVVPFRAQELLDEALANQDTAIHDELAAFQASQRERYARWTQRLAKKA